MEPQIDETFDDVSRIELTGAGSIVITPDGIIEGAGKATQYGDKLTLQGGASVSFTNTNGVQISQSCSISYSSTIIHTVGDGNVVFTINNCVSGAQPAETKLFKLGKNCRIGSVTITGSGTFKQLPPKFTSDTFAATVTGSGDLILPSVEFDSLCATVFGSGDIMGHGTTASDALITVSGSGDVRDLHIHKRGKVCVNGSGDVRITASNPRAVQAERAGTGSITVRSRNSALVV